MASKGSKSEVATRYALALLELAEEQHKLNIVAEDLVSLDKAIEENLDLQRLMASPVISRRVQGKAIGAILTQVGADDLTKKFMGVSSANRRLQDFRHIITAFLAELAKRRGEVVAEITSAQKLSKEQLQAVQGALQRTEGRNVSISSKVDPTLIGGLIVKVGSKMIDSSIKTKLTKMKLIMKGAG